jgi:hypothetical protein
VTNKIIDADALLEFMDSEIHKYINVHGEDWDYGISYHDIKRKINELSTPAEPQESIFDADGWCWDLLLLDNNQEYHFLIERTIANVGYVKANRKTYYQTIGFFDFIQSNLKDTYLCLGDTLKAWRPLPPLPRVG